MVVTTKGVNEYINHLVKCFELLHLRKYLRLLGWIILLLGESEGHAVFFNIILVLLEHGNANGSHFKQMQES